MEQGSLAEQYLNRAVLKMVKASKEKAEVGPGIGNDYACVDDRILADGFGVTPEIAWYKAWNNLLCSLGTGIGARVTYLLPKHIKESQIRDYTERIAKLAEVSGIALLGGHSQVSEGFREPQFLVHMLGRKGTFVPNKKAIKPGCDLVMVGKTGILGTNLLLEKYKDKQMKKYAPRFLEEAAFSQEDYSIAEAVKELQSAMGDIYYLHDVSCGGIYTALWQLGVWSGKGFLVDNRRIPIAQATVEICECFQVNPYYLDGTGALLFLCKQGRAIAEKMRKAGLEASVIGEITEQKEKLVEFAEGEFRTLSPEGCDSIYQDFS